MIKLLTIEDISDDIYHKYRNEIDTRYDLRKGLDLHSLTDIIEINKESFLKEMGNIYDEQIKPKLVDTMDVSYYFEYDEIDEITYLQFRRYETKQEYVDRLNDKQRDIIDLLKRYVDGGLINLEKIEEKEILYDNGFSEIRDQLEEIYNLLEIEK